MQRPCSEEKIEGGAHSKIKFLRRKKMLKVKSGTFILSIFIIAVVAGVGSAWINDARSAEKEPIKVGILHSLSGTMSISEVAVKDGEILAIEEINA